MWRLSLFFLIFCNGVLGENQQFDCKTFNPIFHDGYARQEETSMPLFSISVLSQGEQYASTVKPGQTLSVIVSSSNSATFTSFMLQARFIMSGIGSSPVPGWNPSLHASVKTCGTTERAALVAEYNEATPEFTSISTTWVAPEQLGQAIEFSAVVMDKEGRFWKDIHSVALNSIMVADAPQRDDDEVDQPEVLDPHNSITEEESAIRRVQELDEQKDDEDAESEGKWQVEEMKAKKLHQEMVEWERAQYELQVTEIEREHQKRMHAEIMDKEQYQLTQFETDIKEPEVVLDENEEPAAGVGSFSSLSLAVMVAVILRYFF